MAADKGFTISNDKFTLSHGERCRDGSDWAEYGNPSVDGTPSNIIDGDSSTSCHFKNYSGSRRYVSESFYLLPKKAVSTLRLKINADHPIYVDYTKTDGSIISLVNGAKSIDTTYNINGEVSEIRIIAKKDYNHSDYDDPLDVYFYDVDIECYQLSELRGYDGNSIINFADSINNDTPLKYKGINGNTRSVLLVDIGDSKASRFRTQTPNGIKALAKYTS